MLDSTRTGLEFQALNEPAFCFNLNRNWMRKIAATRSRVSNLMLQISKEKAPSASAAISSSEVNVIHKSSEQQPKSYSLNYLPHLIFPLSPTSDGKEQILQWLKDKDYVHLYQTLSQKSGYPWDEIKVLRSPILMEQLTDIHLLLLSKLKAKADLQPDEAKQMMDFALHIVKISHEVNLKTQVPVELLEETKHILGKLTFLIDNDLQEALKAINQKNCDEAITHIREVFIHHLQKMCERIQKQFLAHYGSQLQSPELAVNALVPVELASALLTETGTINIGIIDILSDIFLSHEGRPVNHEVNLSYALKILQQSPRLRAEFEKIHAPLSTNLPSNDVIRASLHLPAQTPISDLHTRRTALIALLSHLRQGGDGSCFAVSLAIEILSSHLSYCFKDLTQLLEESKLTRRIKGIRKDIPFIERIYDENLNNTLHIDVTGTIYKDNEKLAKLWEAPGLQAAASALKIGNLQTAIEKTISNLEKPIEGALYSIKIKHILKKLAELAAAESDSNTLTDLYTQARFAFSSLTAQPLLKIWENAIAGMAEAEESGMVKSAILQTTLDALQYHLGKLQIPATPFMMQFFLTLQKYLFDNIQLQYDPSAKECEAEHLIEEGFVLHKGKMRIDTAEAFLLFLQNMLIETSELLKKTPLKPDDEAQLKHVILLLAPYIQTKEFMEYFLARYHPSNKDVVEKIFNGQVTNYSSLSFTPWITQTGNSSKVVLSVYLGTDQPIKTEGFVSNEALEALTNIIDMCKKMPDKEKKLFLQNPNKLKPFCISGKHRLPFMAGSPSLSHAWQKNTPTHSWINQFVITPGKEISNSKMDSETLTRLKEKLKHDILPTFFSVGRVQNYLDEIQNIPPSILIKDYRNAICAICEKRRIDHKRLARLIDSAICQSLPPALQKKLEDSAIYFADTNWNHNTHDIHLCFAINPSNEKLEIWEAYSNGSHLVALDQSYWLFNQKWEFFTIPEELVGDDSTHLM
jgi:hypothetical protein